MPGVQSYSDAEAIRCGVNTDMEEILLSRETRERNIRTVEEGENHRQVQRTSFQQSFSI